MERRQWINQGQPQTLVIACFLLYLNAVFGLLNLLGSGAAIRASGIGLVYYGVTIAGGVASGYGIANERKWGYLLGLGTAFFPFALSFYLVGNPFAANPINLIFEIVLVALLLHTQTREYQKVWFK
jgi:hypothetical protein